MLSYNLFICPLPASIAQARTHTHAHTLTRALNAHTRTHKHTHKEGSVLELLCRRRSSRSEAGSVAGSARSLKGLADASVTVCPALQSGVLLLLLLRSLLVDWVQKGWFVEWEGTNISIENLFEIVAAGLLKVGSDMLHRFSPRKEKKVV